MGQKGNVVTKKKLFHLGESFQQTDVTRIIVFKRNQRMFLGNTVSRKLESTEEITYSGNVTYL
jgi:hypothetical protein